MSEIKNDAMALGNRPLVDRRGREHLEQPVRLPSRESEVLAKVFTQWFASHFVLYIRKTVLFLAPKRQTRLGGGYCEKLHHCDRDAFAVEPCVSCSAARAGNSIRLGSEFLQTAGRLAS